MNGVCFRRKHFSGAENEGSRTCYNGVNIYFYNRLHYCSGRRFIQNRTPHGFGLVWTGKIRNPHSHKNQNYWDHEGYEANVLTLLYKHIHDVNVSDSLIQYKLVELM